MSEIKGIFFSDLEKVRRYGIWNIRLFCLSIIPIIILGALSMAQIFSNRYVSVVFGLFTLFNVLLYPLLTFEVNLLKSRYRRKKILESYKCMRHDCRNCTGSCIDVAEWGIYICIYLDHEFKKEMDKLIEVSQINN